MTDIKTQLIKINALLENIGHQRSSVKKDPSLERKAEDIINNNISDIIRFIMEIINSGELTNKKLLAFLKGINHKTLTTSWAEYSAVLKKYVNTPEYMWEE
ncbi:MAG: hypothetical protein JXJ04_21080 [Spirochaetales bacterium]|nr:hypothetical protein [Spirochaetales bacterium]